MPDGRTGVEGPAALAPPAVGANRALGLLAAALVLSMTTWFSAAAVLPPLRVERLGSAAPHLVNGLGGLDWHVVIAVTSLLTLAGGAVVLVWVEHGPYAFPRAPFDPHQVRRVFANRGVRLSSLGYFGHMWELYAMWSWFLVFASDRLFASQTPAALAPFARIGCGAIGFLNGGDLGARIGPAAVP